jgi:subtilisin family serine protease
MKLKQIALSLVALVLVACQDATEPAGAERVVAGIVVVKLEAGALANDVAAAHGLSVERRGPHDAFVLFRGAVGSERALAARLGNDPRVVYAEPDYLRQPTAIDPRLWAFYNPGGLTVDFTRGRNKGSPVTSYRSVADADEDNIEGYAMSGIPVIIGSIDTGVDFGHPEFLPSQLIAGSDWYSNDGNPSDENGHGTHTTGTMAGQSVGVAGVAGAGANVQVYVQRVCGPLGCPLSAIAAAIIEAADYPGMVAMNLSLGGSSESQAEKDAIAYAATKDVLVIASAGNGGTSTVSCPACDPLAISVAASNWQDELSYYSNWGSGLDITAPGGELYSNTTDEAGIYSAYVAGGYEYLQGTSMAAPQVTGTAGIVASVTGLTGSALRTRLEGTTDDLGASGYDTSFGHGRVNSYRAVTNSTLDEGDPGGGGEPLTASFTYSCGGNSTCDFDGSGSTGATSYDWDFTGLGTASGVTATYTFTSAGAYVVTLTVGDGSATDAASRTVSCQVKGRKLRCS